MTLRSPTSDTLNGRSRRTAKVDVQTGARCKPKRVGEGQISLLRPLAPVHGANPTKLFKWLYGIGKKETIDLTLPIIEETIGIDARTCRRIIATWAETGVCEKTVHRRGMRIRLLMDEKEALGAPRAASPSVSASPADELERALPELCPRLMEVGFTAKHLRRIKELLAVQNIDPGSLTDALRYAEYELEHGQMVDSKGQPVSRPVDWVFRCLSKDGIYRIPTGYVSPAELRRREREEAVRREREALEAERCSVSCSMNPTARLPHRSWRRFPLSCVRAGGWRTRWCRRPAGCRSAICSRTPSERGSRAILRVHSVRTHSMDTLGG